MILFISLVLGRIILNIPGLIICAILFIMSRKILNKIGLSSYFKSNIGYLSHYTNKKLLRYSDAHPEDGRFFFKLYIFKLIINRFWNAFLSQPKTVRKQLILSASLHSIFTTLLYEYRVQQKFYFPNFLDRFFYLIINFTKVKLRDLEKVYNVSQDELNELFIKLPEKIELHKLKKVFFQHHLTRIKNILHTEFPFSSIHFHGIWYKYCIIRELPPKIRDIYDVWGNINRADLDKVAIEKLYELDNITAEKLRDLLEFVLLGTNNPKSIVHATEVFKINDLLKVVLFKGKSIIVVNNKQFMHCKYLLLNLDANHFEKYDDIESIDDAAKRLDHSLEYIEYKISPKAEFWGHCSNLQAWAENNYDPRLIHSNLAFPLLKILSEEGDLIAQNVFKEEVIHRLKNNNYNIAIHFLQEGYFNDFTEEEIYTLLHDLYRDKCNNIINLLEDNLIPRKKCCKCGDAIFYIAIKTRYSTIEYWDFLMAWNNIKFLCDYCFNYCVESIVIDDESFLYQGNKYSETEALIENTVGIGSIFGEEDYDTLIDYQGKMVSFNKQILFNKLKNYDQNF